MIALGTLTLPHGLLLAPMAGYTDYGLRRVCHEAGAELTVTEMISAKATVFGDKKTHALARIREDEGPCVLQLFGAEADDLARAAEILSQGVEGGVPPVAIDINMGCPVHKIFSNGEGSALMRDPSHIERLVRAVCAATDLPVTVKLRAGIDSATRNAVDCALAAEAGGAAAITVHGRTRQQMYSGKADREIIKNVKNYVHIPVIANGDITSGADALEMLRYTGADGVAVGRGAVGNPFIFDEIRAAISGEGYSEPTLKERVECALRQLREASLDKGERIAVPEARKQIALYLKGFRGASTLRARINASGTLAEVKEALKHAADDLCSSV